MAYAKQFGLRFGPTDQDIADVTSWLTARGFTIEEVGKGRLWINFSGNVQQVERAFQTNIRKYEVNGKMYQADSGDPTFPRGFAGLVGGVVTLHNFPRVHFLSRVKRAPPSFFSTRSQMPSDFKRYLYIRRRLPFWLPEDFATIYNVNPLYGAGITGAGSQLHRRPHRYRTCGRAIFRSFFGLPAKILSSSTMALLLECGRQ
jgi:subtilase family serine protease